MSLLSLAFSSPWILLALAGAPALYFLLKVTPPPPKQVAFPPLRLILGERRDDATPARTPLWLLLLRMALAALIVLAMAGPSLVPQGAAGGKGPLLLLIDNVWTAAPDWAARQSAAENFLEGAARENRPAAVLGLAEKPFIALENPGAALARLRALTPRPYLPPRAPALPAIDSFLREHGNSEAVWLSDGLENEDGRAFAQKLASLAPNAAVLTGERPPRALTGARNGADALDIDIARAPNAAPEGQIRAFDSHGAALGDAPFTFFGADQRTTARLTLPLQLRNDVARLALVGETSTGGVFLLDAGARRRRVGLVGGAKADQPLLSPLYYLRKALSPQAELREEKPGEPDPIGRLIGEGADVLILADMVLPPDSREKLKKFMEAGGTVVRFAGPRLAAAPDDLLPVKLRRGGRTLGGALSWDKPKTLAPFEDGPFSGLTPPADANVSRQILAEPEPGLPQKTWARLADGTPLVTAEPRGAGTLALFHIAAETSWSNLPLSGLFVDMLKKILARAGAVGPAAAGQGEGLLPVLQNLDGFGALGPPSAEARALPARGDEKPNAEHPPGYYGAPDSPRALNAFADGNFRPLDLTGLTLRPQTLAAPRAVDLRGPLLVTAALLALADAFAAFWLGGGWRRQAAPAALVLLALLAPPPANAQERARADKWFQPALTTSLAYVVTGDSHADRISAQGLKSLSDTLAQRTSFNPGAPRAVDPARDELAFYPMIYWPVSPDAPQPSAAVAQKIAAYMKQGGLMLFDTRDAAQQGEGGATTPAQDWLKIFLQKLDPPPLASAPRNHVIFRTFYLLEGLSGRSETGPTYIEALPPETEGEKAPARAGDGVSPLIVASSDLAAGWASDQWGEALYPAGADSIRQHELALRGGVNIVIYTLTGNYKADQVHVPELLERLGQ